VGQPRGEGAQGDQGLALPRVALDPPRGPDQPAEQVDREREPPVDVRTELLGPDPEHPARLHDPPAAHVDAVLVPGPEPTGPLAPDLHGRHHRLLVPDPPDQVDAPVEQQPPVVGGPPLVEELLPRLEVDLVAGGGQLGDLLVGEPVEQRGAAQVVVEHQTVAR
jgi:hypothetical protein